MKSDSEKVDDTSNDLEDKKIKSGLAEIQTRPVFRSSLTINKILNDGADLPTLVGQLYKQAAQVIEENNTDVLESMLLNQAQVLQAVFHYAAERVSGALMVQQVEAYSGIAIRANNACRKTILALHQLKNPSPTTFIRQQNNALNQQINQGNSPENSQKPTNELLSIEEKAHETLDFGRASAPVEINSNLEAMDKGRSKNARRKSD